MSDELKPRLNFRPLPPEEVERRLKVEQESKTRRHYMKVDGILAECGAPRRHLEFKVERTGRWANTLASIEEVCLGTGLLIALVGVRGNGKTQLGVELIKAAAALERSAAYTTALAFFTRIKNTYRKDSDESELEILRALRRPKFLVIDEIGKRADTEWENNQLFELINNRYGDMTDTLLIDNRSKDDFLATLGPSLSSRMLETGGVIEASWDSFRK